MTDHHINTNRNKNLSKAKQALLAKRLRGDSGNSHQTDAIPVRANTDSIPLSYAQGRFWFLYQLDPLNPAYNMYNVVRLQGRLDIAILTESFRTLVHRHQILRTEFITETGRSIQKIVPNINFKIPVIDFQSVPQSEKEGRVQEWIRSEIRRPFDLSQCPLLRVSLIKQNDDDHILVLTIHHIISDEWSIELLWREISILYQSFLNDHSPTLPELPVQYADFTLWQKQQVKKQMETQFAYWKKQLDIDLSLLQLSTDHIRPARQAFRGALKWIRFPDELSLRLKALNKVFGTTTFMTLLTAFQVLLHRYTRQNDILVGTPIANRKRPEIKNLIGLFLNTLVMRAHVKDNPRFDDLVKQTRQTALDGYANQDLPFEKLVDGLQTQRNASYNPIFQVMFVHQKSVFDAIDIQGLAASKMPVDIGVAKFDLTLFVEESTQNLSAGLEYNTDLFDSNTADRILGHFQTLLESIVEDPKQRVSKLQLMTAAEREMLMHKWNNSQIPTPQPPQIQQFIEQRAELNPEAIAVVDDADQLTYRELDKRANQLARFIRKIGVGANTPVGLVLERSINMIVSILGVLKAGGAYLPLDPDYPSERLNFMLADTQAPVVLTQKKLARFLPDHKAKTVFIDAEWDLIAREDSTVPRVAAALENRAYVIYTSGSTGKPKGVLVSHKNLVHSTSARFQFYEKKVNRFLLLSSFTFDSSVVGIFWTLCQGGTLVLPPQRTEQDIPNLAATIASHGISHILALPSLYAILLEQSDPKSLASLNTVIVAGEACRPKLVDLHYTKLPRATLFNEYGPTECTVWSTAYKIPPNFEGNCVPIGRPIPNTQNYILDIHNQLVPIGVPGELCIGGGGVTSGYLNRSELTAEKFIEYAIGSDPPAYLYRTGDLARYLPDGNIEFLGRIDQQVKIRGFRIELGEIESVFDQHSAVHNAVVVIREDQPDNKRIIAYVVLKPNADVTIDKLQVYVRNKLPEYMVPSDIIFLEMLPLMQNGKVDRKALPVPKQLKTGNPEAYVAPTDSLEIQLIRLWEKVLGARQIGITDDFFKLGGHSLLALKVLFQIRKFTGKEIPLPTLYAAPTVSQLADTIRKDGWTSPFSLLIPIQPLGTKPPFFSIHAAPSGIFERIRLEQPYYCGIPHGTNGKQFEPILNDMVSDYIREIKLLQPQGPYFIGGYSFGGLIAFEIACKLFTEGHKIATLVMIEPTSNFFPKPKNLSRTRIAENNKAESLIEYLSRVRKKIVNLEIREKFRYIFGRIWRRSFGRWAIQRKVKLFVCNFCVWAGILVPEKLRLFYQSNLFKKSIENYTPNIFPGDANLFQATKTKNNFVLSWREYIAGKTEVHTIDCDHMDIFNEPNASVLADKLSRVLLCAHDNLKKRK